MPRLSLVFAACVVASMAIWSGGAAAEGPVKPAAGAFHDAPVPAAAEPLDFSIAESFARPRAWRPRPGLGLRPHWRPEPMATESWLYRPLSAGWFVGTVQGGPLVDDWLGQKQGFFGGFRLGWDQSDQWGWELRFAFGSIELYDSPSAAAAQVAADDAAGLAPDDPYRDRFNPRRDADLFQWDANVLYYPWGNTRWRPFLAAGLGSAHLQAIDRLDQSLDRTALAMSLAAGAKYRWSDWLALRFACTDNIGFFSGDGLSAVHNVSFTGGVEVRFGGRRVSYWPWNASRHYW